MMDDATASSVMEIYLLLAGINSINDCELEGSRLGPNQ
jgi:hypothetical protein